MTIYNYTPIVATLQTTTRDWPKAPTYEPSMEQRSSVFTQMSTGDALHIIDSRLGDDGPEIIGEMHKVAIQDPNKSDLKFWDYYHDLKKLDPLELVRRVEEFLQDKPALLSDYQKKVDILTNRDFINARRALEATLREIGLDDEVYR